MPNLAHWLMHEQLTTYVRMKDMVCRWYILYLPSTLYNNKMVNWIWVFFWNVFAAIVGIGIVNIPKVCSRKRDQLMFGHALLLITYSQGSAQAKKGRPALPNLCPAFWCYYNTWTEGTVSKEAPTAPLPLPKNFAW